MAPLIVLTQDQGWWGQTPDMCIQPCHVVILCPSLKYQTSCRCTHVNTYTVYSGAEVELSPFLRVDTNTRTRFKDDYYPTHATMGDHLASPNFRNSALRSTGHVPMSQMSTTDPRFHLVVSSNPDPKQRLPCLYSYAMPCFYFRNLRTTLGLELMMRIHLTPYQRECFRCILETAIRCSHSGKTHLVLQLHLSPCQGKIFFPT